MRIRVRIAVRQPLCKRKRFLLPNGMSAYAHFEYEKLTLFCFLYGKLGRGESFYPLRATIPEYDIIFQWDLTLRSPSRKVVVWKSKWLMEEGDGEGSKFGNSKNSEIGGRFESHRFHSPNQGEMEGNNQCLS